MYVLSFTTEEIGARFLGHAGDSTAVAKVRAMEYSEVIHTVDTLRRRGWRIDELGTADGYPIFGLRHDPGQHNPGDASHVEIDRAPSLLMCAGIHGEEPAAVVGLCRWLVASSDAWLEHLRFTIIPCLNPWGYERGIRYSAAGEDLNRQFEAPRHPAVQAFRHFIEGKSFDLFLDLHEDCDFTRMYLYEAIDTARPLVEPTLGRRILERAQPDVELSHQELAEELEIQHGMIRVGMSRKEARSFTNAPVALYVYGHHAPHTVTVETPGKLDLDLRADVQMRAIDETCRYLTSLG